jgi:hypothetical protein
LDNFSPRFCSILRQTSINPNFYIWAVTSKDFVWIPEFIEAYMTLISLRRPDYMSEVIKSSSKGE